MEIAVIGGSGFLGSHLLQELNARPSTVRLISSGSSPGRKQQLSPDVKHVHISFENRGEIRDALSGCSAIAYLSGINKEKKPGDFERVHVRYLQSVIETAKELSITKVVYTSFLKARPDPLSKYLQSKWEGEELLRSSNMDYTILKPGICFGSGDQMISSIVRGLQLTPLIGLFAAVGLHEQPMRPVHAKDMASIIAGSLLEGRLSKQTYAIVGPEELTLSEAVRRVAKVLKKPVIIFHSPISLMFASAWVIEHVMKNPLVSVSQIKMLADGLSESTAESLPLPVDLKPKTYFTEDQIQKAMNQIR